MSYEESHNNIIKMKLCDVPIYAMSKNEHTRRWQQKIRSLCSELETNGVDQRKSAQYVDSLLLPRYLWEYNMIIVYIKISASRSDIWFDYYAADVSKHFADTKIKHYIQNQLILGCHFNVRNKNYSNTDIVAEIYSWLHFIERRFVKRYCYVDYEAFDSLIRFTNLNQIMNNT